jgi:hypothetical protein
MARTAAGLAGRNIRGVPTCPSRPMDMAHPLAAVVFNRRWL